MQQRKTLGTSFTLACGHTVRTSPMNPFAYMDAVRTPCMRCLMENKVKFDKDGNLEMGQ